MIDHLVFAAPDLNAAVDWLAGRLGLRAAAGGRHPGLGTRNALLGLGGGTYLEIIGVDADGPGPPDGPRPFGLDRIGEARLATWAAGVDDIHGRVAAARAAGYDPGPVGPMSRRLPDGGELHWRLTPPGADAVELVPFLIQWGDGAPHPSTTAPAGCRLASFAGAHPDPDAITAALGALGVGLAVSYAAAPELVAVIDGPGGTIELR
jgi:catechol 2,3-dioxygenase-like lactoylglutathione lyase family enzyme